MVVLDSLVSGMTKACRRANRGSASGTYWRAAVGALGLMAIGISGPGLSGQEIIGSVWDSRTGLAVPEATLRLFDDAGSEVVVQFSDSTGAFRMSTSIEGDYSVSVSVLGYQPLESPPLRLTSERPMSVRFELDPDPVELLGVEAAARRVEEFRDDVVLLGVDIGDLGRRFIGTEDIERQVSARDAADVIDRRGAPGIEVLRSSSGQEPCVTFSRGRSGAGMTSCALLAVDGSLVNRSMLQLIPVEMIAGIVLMQPREASLVFGTTGGVGVVVVLTKGRSPPR